MGPTLRRSVFNSAISDALLARTVSSHHYRNRLPLRYVVVPRRSSTLPTYPRALSIPTASSRTMSSDADYASFLDKANQDTSAPAKASSSSSKNKSAQLKAVDENATVPAPLKELDATYTSESDEPFEPVVLENKKGSGKLDKDSLAELIGHGAGVEELSTEDFDPRGEYKKVLQAVESAGAKGTKVFRVETGKSRAEYFVVGLDGEGRVVGVRARAVET